LSRAKLTLVPPAEQIRALSWQDAMMGLALAAFGIKQMARCGAGLVGRRNGTAKRERRHASLVA
jgi:hypothetical protein